MLDEITKQYIDRHFERLNAKLTTLLAEKKKSTWVKARTIIDLTGWDHNQMRKARECGTVVHKREKGHFFYLLESLPQVLINVKQTSA